MATMKELRKAARQVGFTVCVRGQKLTVDADEDVCEYASNQAGIDQAMEDVQQVIGCAEQFEREYQQK